jgi:hypothetical protein
VTVFTSLILTEAPGQMSVTSLTSPRTHSSSHKAKYVQRPMQAPSTSDLLNTRNATEFYAASNLETSVYGSFSTVALMSSRLAFRVSETSGDQMTISSTFKTLNAEPVPMTQGTYSRTQLSLDKKSKFCGASPDTNHITTSLSQ